MSGKSCSLAWARSLVDPWSAAACIPDGAAGVGRFTVRQTGTLTTGGTGSAVGIYLNPGTPQACILTDTGSTSATATIGANWLNAQAIASMVGLYPTARTTGCALKVTYTGNTTNDQGILVFGQVAGRVPINSLNTGNVNSFGNIAQYYKTSPVRNGACVTWRPNEVDDVEIFNAYANASLPTSQTFEQPWIFINAFGMASAQTLQYEFVINFEGQYSNGTFMPGGLSRTAQNPAEPGWYEVALNAIRDIDPLKAIFSRSSTAFATSLISGYMGKSEVGSRNLPRITMPTVEDLD